MTFIVIKRTDNEWVPVNRFYKLNEALDWLEALEVWDFFSRSISKEPSGVFYGSAMMEKAGRILHYKIILKEKQ